MKPERAEKAEIAALLALNPGDECYYYMGRAFAPEQVRVMEVHDHPDSPYPHLLRKRFTVDFLVYCKQEPGSMVPCECAPAAVATFPCVQAQAVLPELLVR